MISILYFVKWYPGQNSNYNSPWFFSFLRWIKSYSPSFHWLFFLLKGELQEERFWRATESFWDSARIFNFFPIPIRRCENFILIRTNRYIHFDYEPVVTHRLEEGGGGKDHMVFRGNRGVSVVTNRVYGNTKIDCQWGGIIRLLRSLRGDLVTKILSLPPPL